MKLFFITALAAAVALGSAPAPTTAQALATIRVATTPIDIGAQPFYAEDLGFFKAHGLTVETQEIANGGAIVAAVVGGSIDIAQSNVVSLAQAHERGLPLVVIAPAGMYSWKTPTSALVVAGNSPYHTAKDLNGKTIGCNGLKNISQIGPQAWMDANGGDQASAKYLEMTFGEMSPALQSGRIDAGLLAEPFLSRALAQGNRILGPAYDGIAKNFLIGAWFTTAAWAKAHPDLVKRFQASMLETATWANKHQAESAPILLKYTKIAVSPNMKRAMYSQKMEVGLMQPVINASAKYGAIKAPFPAIDLMAAEAR